jgi:hypothetical protein
VGGKSTNSQQQVSIPPSVLAQYQSVNARANQTASTPFKDYTGQFVAPINPEQNTGIIGTNAAATQAQPYFGQATSDINATQAATNPVNAAAEAGTAASASQLTGADINRYLSPYLSTVLGSTAGLINQNNAVAQSGALGTAISSGAFGGDRTGLAAANLEQQQNLAAGNIYSGIANQGYQSALGTAQGQQQIGLAGAAQEAQIGQTAYGEGANTASTIAGLGAGAQTAGLQGAQAQIGAGSIEQQTQQAKDTALYNQFLQQQSYPFQVDQFLANIAEGTGALSGSTTSTTQPGGFFSDKRLKHDIKKVGKLYDGQHIYSYKMHGDPRTHIGLIAQNVEKKHPEAVGLAAGYKTVDYGKATEKAANRDHFWEGGVAGRRAYAYGGGYTPSGVSPIDFSAILQAQHDMYAPYGGQGEGVYGSSGTVPRGGSSRVPAPNGATPHLITASGGLSRQPTGMENVTALTNLTKDATQAYTAINKARQRTAQASAPAAPTAPVAGVAQSPSFASSSSDTSAPAASNVTDPNTGNSAASADLAAPAFTPESHGGRVGLASGGGPYSNVAGAGSTQLGIPLATEGHSAFMKRGGVAGRHGYDDGGMPYGGVGGAALDIPNDPSNRALATAPALQGGSGGGGGSSTMKDIGQVAGTALSVAEIAAMFMNRGGRAGYADGGSPADPSQDPDLVQAPSDGMLPESTVVSKASHEKVPGVAPTMETTPPVDAGPTPSAGIAPPPEKAPKQPDSGESFWDKVKKPENLVPLLTAIGAMGTAPTRHLGVALAAGLGAGAQSYYPAHEAEQEVRGQDIQNQMQQFRLDMMRNTPNLGPPSTGQGPPPGLGGAVDKQSIMDAAQKNYAFKETWTPQETAALDYNMRLQRAGMPNSLQTIMTQHNARMENQKAGMQLGANLDYQHADAIFNASPGTAFGMLQSINPEAAANIQKIATAKGLDADGLARSYASDVGQATHQWSGRAIDTSQKDGIARDGPLNHPLLGGVPSGMSPDTWASYSLARGKTEDTGARARPTVASLAKGTGVAPPVTPASPYAGGAAPLPVAPATSGAPLRASPAPGGGGAAAARPARIARQPAAPAGSGAGPSAIPALNASYNKPPPAGGVDVSTAPNKPPWLDNPSTVLSDHQQKYSDEIYPAFEKELQDDANSKTALQKQLVDAQRVQNLLPNAKLGPGTAAMSQAQALFENMTGVEVNGLLNNNPSARAMIEKMLANTALGKKLEEFREAGAQVRLGTAESKLIIDKLSAGTEMPAEAVKNLVNWHAQELKWELGKAQAAQPYLSAGKDAAQFDGWYADHHPYESAVTTAAPTGTLTHPHTPTPGAAQAATVTSKADYDALPSGAKYTFNGRQGTKP